MIKRNLIAMAVTCLFLVTACRSEEAPEKLHYGIASAQWWPVIVFITDINLALPPIMRGVTARNAGWDYRLGDTPARLGPRVAEDGQIWLDLLWHEVATQQSFAARVTVSPDDLERDPLAQDSLILVMRIGRQGYVDAVTYETTFPPQENPPPARLLTWVCGPPAKITDPKILKELERVQDEPLNRERFAHVADIDDVPTRYEGER